MRRRGHSATGPQARPPSDPDSAPARLPRPSAGSLGGASSCCSSDVADPRGSLLGSSLSPSDALASLESLFLSGQASLNLVSRHIHAYMCSALPPGAPAEAAPLALCLQPTRRAVFSPGPGAPLSGPAPSEPCAQPGRPRPATLQRGTLDLHDFNAGTATQHQAVRKTITLRLRPGPEAAALQRAAQVLSAEPVGYAVRDGRMAAGGGGMPAAARHAVPLLAWTVEAAPGEPGCGSLVTFSPWVAGGDVAAALQAVAEGAGVGAALGLGAVSGAEAVDGPLMDRRRLVQLLAGSVEAWEALAWYSLLMPDLKLENIMGSWLCDPAGTVPLRPLAAFLADEGLAPSAACAPGSVPALERAMAGHGAQAAEFSALTRAYAPSEAYAREAPLLAAAAARDNPAALQRLRDAPSREPGLAEAVALVREGRDGELRAGLHGRSHMRPASHACLWGRSVLRALNRAEATLVARAEGGGRAGIGAANTRLLAALSAVCRACTAPLPSQRPAPAVVAMQLRAIAAWA
ncbi:hypothetical protein HYH03_000631 [Edaphochlamys debaryana]|uniref:Uncharacterized protein n=1 Tax=Edaphochlamys debaryana TaxID=47281 RepID=A0A835YQR5_9CHLO|nr:hypothetical protein HYH03_000631 [Edaphochlamys debaryana]|eukprot:KAG2502144.1 hypothetical protein HYH03_000631 [Edaphochlamys debaryana]